MVMYFSIGGTDRGRKPLVTKAMWTSGDAALADDAGVFSNDYSHGILAVTYLHHSPA